MKNKGKSGFILKIIAARMKTDLQDDSSFSSWSKFEHTGHREKSFVCTKGGYRAGNRGEVQGKNSRERHLIIFGPWTSDLFVSDLKKGIPCKKMYICLAMFSCFAMFLQCFAMICYMFDMFLVCFIMLCYIYVMYCYVLLCFAMFSYVFAIFCYVFHCLRIWETSSPPKRSD